MKNKSLLLAVGLVLFFHSTSLLYGQNSNQLSTISNQWTATDALGRKLPYADETGPSRKNKYIGMFYWTWHTDGNATFSPVMNITEILNKYPEAATDANHSAWQGISPGVFWWDEPLFGYYRTTDEWILRKHAEMLADAGVDVVFFDCTNGSLTWKSSYTELLKVWEQARQDGVNTPKIAFMMPFGAVDNATVSINELYSDLYSKNLYSDLWFMWNGKPVIMGYPEMMAQPGQSAGLKFHASSAFTGISARCPSWGNNIGNLTMRLYKWNTNYAQSISSTPIASQTFENFNDNQLLEMSVPQQPAGDYVWELNKGTETVGVWKWTDSTDPITSYFNGAGVTGAYESQILYPPSTSYTNLTNGTAHVPVQIFGAGISQERIDSIKAFFTFRPGQPDYVSGPSRNDQWGWLENSPQHGYVPKTGGGFEEVTVGVAQNASDASGGHASGFNTPLTYGRSYTKAFGQDARPDAYLKGLNFQEQWDNANILNPDLVFVTGWNEWIAGRWFDWDVKPFAFVDEYSAEKSRDIEPVKSWGNKGDVYYNQLVRNVRKFKGMNPADTVSASKTIDMANSTSWNDVKPAYQAYKGNTLHRNHPGQGTSLVYTNSTGRNDIILAKVARDDSYVYFQVQTTDNLTPKSDPKWMRLFIDIDRNKTTGWEGYDFLVNRSSPSDSALVENSVNSWNWNKAGAAAYTVDGNTLVLKIKRSILGIKAGEQLNFEFKWSDNMQEDGNIMDFYINGDAAPGGRFNYIYRTDWSDDRYLYSENPVGINSGLKSELYAGVFDTIPAFNSLKVSQTDYMQTIGIPVSTSTKFALKQTGFIDVPAKDNYIFTMNTDLSARLYIGCKLVIQSGKTTGQQSGAIKLMPGKHALSIEYITQSANTPMLEFKMQSSSLAQGNIPAKMLFKNNVPPTISLSFNRVQNYFSPADSVVIGKAIDSDGKIAKVEVFDNELSIGVFASGDLVVENQAIGNHLIRATTTDNDSAKAESNILKFEVKAPFDMPGSIDIVSYSAGKSVTILNSNDLDGGKIVRLAYGYVEYPVNVATDGTYRISFRVPAATGSKNVTIESNYTTVGAIDVGNTGNSQSWFDKTVDVTLKAGIQNLHFDCSGLITIHRIDISNVTGLNDVNENLVRVYPNPSQGGFLVQSSDARANLLIYDMLGKIVDRSDAKAISFERRIGLDLHPGIYLLVVTLTNGTKQRVKIIKR